MSKRKQLIHDVFERIKETSEKDTKYGWSDDLSDAIEKKIKFKVSGKTLSRYYDAYIDGINEEKGIEKLILNRLSQYLGFKDYEDFCTTIEKKGEDAHKTTVKIDVDENEVSSINGLPNINVSIVNTNSNDNNNEQHFKVPEFIKQNGLGILEITFVLLMVTGGVVSSHTKSLGWFSGAGAPAIDKKYMYWEEDRYMATDSSILGPLIEIVPMNQYLFKHFKKIMRKDTMTVENSYGKVWCSKYNNDVDFFTMDGTNPENGKELKLASEHMILKYSGQELDSIQVEE